MKCLILLSLFVSSAIAANLPALKANDLFNQKEVSTEWKDAPLGSVIIFLSSVCPCSNAHMEHLKKLPQEFPEFKFFAIHSNTDEKADEALEYFRTAALPFPVLKDNNSEWANKLKAYRTPHSFIINKEGKVLYQGGVSSSSHPGKDATYYLQDALTELKSGKSVSVTQTRVLGCEIARK